MGPIAEASLVTDMEVGSEVCLDLNGNLTTVSQDPPVPVNTTVVTRPPHPDHSYGDLPPETSRTDCGLAECQQKLDEMSKLLEIKNRQLKDAETEIEALRIILEKAGLG